ncbi:MAG: hypothetical protein ACR2HG_07835 [Pyrinomonadaceae bacterium]
MKTFISILFVLIFSFSAFAQTDKNSVEKPKPDFSGTWILDRAKSKKVDFDLTLIVVHKEPEMKVTKIYNFKGAKKTDEQTYYTDGRRVPDSEMGSEIITQQAFWAGNNLIHKYQVSKAQGKTVEQTNTEKWELSKDGKTLTLTMTETLPATNPNQNGKMQTNQGVTSQADFVKELKFKREDETIR